MTETNPSSRLNLGLALAVFVIGVFAFLEVYAIQAILPILMHDFNASPAEIGFTVGATVLAVAIMSPFMGLLSDAKDARKSSWRLCCSWLYPLRCWAFPAH